MKKLSLKDFQERLDTFFPMEDLEAISWGGSKEDSIVKCRKCGNIYIKKGSCFLDKGQKSICKQCFPTQPNTLKRDWKPPQGYILLSQYTGMHHKVTVKHEQCGFIWNITPANLKLGKGCPKCNKKISKGEQKIRIWLDNNNIKYIFQYPIDIEGHKLTIDFYLPFYDLYIEYNGEQHYNSIEFFGGEERLAYQKANDALKQKYLKDKLLIIPYTEYDNIENLLESSTTISKESTLQANGSGSGKFL